MDQTSVEDNIRKAQAASKKRNRTEELPDDRQLDASQDDDNVNNKWMPNRQTVEDDERHRKSTRNEGDRYRRSVYN